MGKLVAHLVVAVCIIAGARHFHLAGWVTAILVLLGFTIVHQIWERMFSNPFDLLGAVPVSDDDPLMVAAKAEALATWPAFLGVYPDHRNDTIVKFRLGVKDGTVENVWGDLVEIDGDTAKVYLRTPPIGDAEIHDRNMVIPISDIVDWQIEYMDGTLRGGFTMQATFRIFAREQGHMPPEFLEQLSRYKPLEESAA